MKDSQAAARIIFQQRHEKSTKGWEDVKKLSKFLASVFTDEDDEMVSHTT